MFSGWNVVTLECSPGNIVTVKYRRDSDGNEIIIVRKPWGSQGFDLFTRFEFEADGGVDLDNGGNHYMGKWSFRSKFTCGEHCSSIKVTIRDPASGAQDSHTFN